MPGSDLPRNNRRSTCRDLFTQCAHTLTKNAGSLRCFSGPERKRRRRAMRVLYEHATRGFNPLDPPTRVTKQNYIARTRIDGKMFVERRDLHSFRLQNYVEQSRIRNGAAVRNGNHPRAAACVQLALDAIMQQIGAVATPARLDSIRKNSDHFFKLPPSQVAIRVGAPENFIEGLFIP